MKRELSRLLENLELNRKAVRILKDIHEKEQEDRQWYFDEGKIAALVSTEYLLLDILCSYDDDVLEELDEKYSRKNISKIMAHIGNIIHSAKQVKEYH